MIIDCEDCKVILYKSSSVEYCTVGDIVTYKIDVINKFCGNLEDVIIKDLLPSDLKFIKGSVCVNNKPYKDANIIAGVCIGIIDSCENITITYDATVISKTCPEILNQATAEYKYKENHTYYYQYCDSNCNKLVVKNPNIELCKVANVDSVYLNDEIEYTIIITNTGDLEVFNVSLIDKIPSSIELIDGSFYIDENIVNSVEIDKGVVLNKLSIGERKVVKYKAKVVSSSCNGKIENEAFIKYSYKLGNGNFACKTSNISKSVVNMHICSFKQLSIDEYLWIPTKKPNIEEINDIKVHIKIDKYNIIETSNSRSSEGQILSGYKLVIHGYINQIIEYTSCDSSQIVHSVNYNAPFSTFIILPVDFKFGSKIDIESIIEDTNFIVVDKRCFFRNVTVLMLAKITSF